MDLRELQVFCKIVELKSFSRAAEAVFLTQPTVSGHIKALEEELGLRLFDRAGKHITATKAGELLYGYARRMLAVRAEAEQALAEFKGGLKGSLCIGGSSIPGAYVLPPLIARFKQEYPDVKIHLKIGDSREACRAVLSDDPLFFVVNAYAVDAPAVMLHNVLVDILGGLGGTIEAGELVVPQKARAVSGAERLLSTGIVGRWSRGAEARRGRRR